MGVVDKQDFEWLQGRSDDWNTIELGFVRNLDKDIKRKYHDLYKKYVDDRFILDYNCRTCIFNLLERLKQFYQSIPDAPAIEEVIQPDLKRTIPPKPVIDGKPKEGKERKTRG